VLITSLNQQGADYLLIGGCALFAHGYHRATTDIDVLVPATEETGRKVREALMVLPDQAAKDIDPAWFSEGENIRVADAALAVCYSTSSPSAQHQPKNQIGFRHGHGHIHQSSPTISAAK
jgi:hypothetical protein